MRKFLLIIVALALTATAIFIGVMQLQGKSQATYGASVVSALSNDNTTGFARATTVRDFTFPKDYGAHPEFQTEWWYYTGNLEDSIGRRFGFELTIFRRALTPTLPQRQSDWATNQIYFADFAISDIGDNQFFNRGRFSRGAAGLAGAETDPRVHVWIEDWSMLAHDDAAKTMHLHAVDDPIALDLITQEAKPPTLEGDRGLSAKSPEPGNASYYFSLTRLLTNGTITVNGNDYKVSGTAWMDHEFSTSSLSKDALGWDWFALQLDDKRELMLYQIRKQDGSIEITSDGTLVNSDGSILHLTKDDYKIEVLDHWTSPKTGTLYPSRWRVTIKTPDGPLTLEITPLMADQELNSTTPYWEGASRIVATDSKGATVFGYGYVELTGYNKTQPSNDSVPPPG